MTVMTGPQLRPVPASPAIGGGDASQRGLDPPVASPPTEQVQPPAHPPANDGGDAAGAPVVAKKVGKYKLTHQIGQGGFSVVLHAVDMEARTACAVKMCNKTRLVETGMLGELENEIAVLKQVKSRHIANLLDIVQTGRYYYLFLDLCDGTLLQRVMSSQHTMGGRACLPEDVSRRYFQGLLLAVYACHQQGVMHRDIKPENILLTKDDEVKLSDFGFACPVDKLDRVRSQCGTRQYLAPEILELRQHPPPASQPRDVDGFASDVWACGVTLYVCAVGRLPFPSHGRGALQQVRQAQFVLPPAVGAELCGVITTVLMPDPSRRPSVFQIMEMPWFRAGFDSRLVDDINKALRVQRTIGIMHERYSRHVPESLRDPCGTVLSPPVVDSLSCGSTTGYDSGLQRSIPGSHPSSHMSAFSGCGSI